MSETPANYGNDNAPATSASTARPGYVCYTMAAPPMVCGACRCEIGVGEDIGFNNVSHDGITHPIGPPYCKACWDAGKRAPVATPKVTAAGTAELLHLDARENDTPCRNRQCPYWTAFADDHCDAMFDDEPAIVSCTHYQPYLGAPAEPFDACPACAAKDATIARLTGAMATVAKVAHEINDANSRADEQVAAKDAEIERLRQRVADLVSEVGFSRAALTPTPPAEGSQT